jgi:hypothetical protein
MAFAPSPLTPAVTQMHAVQAVFGAKSPFLISGRQHHATIPLGFSGHLFGKGQSVLW